MKIILLEGQLAAKDKIIEKLKNIDSPHKYEIFKTPLIKQIDEISKGFSPAEPLQSWSE